MGRTLVLFDVDGTLTVPRNNVQASMLTFLADLKKVVAVGIVGGSNLVKIEEQMGSTIKELMDFTFAENGLVAYKGSELLATQSLKTHLGEDKLKSFISFVLRYIAHLDIPIKRGTFVEFRNGMLNISPIGRNCSQAERDDFEQFDSTAGVRTSMISELNKHFPDIGMTYSIGGQISFDAFPVGWDKTYCLRYVQDEYQDIHFFGDKTYEGGNDHEIYQSDRTIGHMTTGPDDTLKQCTKLFMPS